MDCNLNIPMDASMRKAPQKMIFIQIVREAGRYVVAVFSKSLCC